VANAKPVGGAQQVKAQESAQVAGASIARRGTRAARGDGSPAEADQERDISERDRCWQGLTKRQLSCPDTTIIAGDA